MAIKIKKKNLKSNKPEPEEMEVLDPLDEPDQFIKTADTSISWAANNRQTLMIGVVVLILAVIAGVAVMHQMDQARHDRSAELTKAITTMLADVESPDAKDDPASQPAITPKKTGPTYASEKEKYDAMYKSSDAVLSAYSSESIASPAGLIKAQAAHKLGKFDEAITLYQGWLDKNPKSTERPFILQALAMSQAANKKPDEAVTSLNALKAINDKAYGELVSYQIAQIYEAAGQKDKAKTQYDTFVKSYPESDRLEMVKLRLDLL